MASSACGREGRGKGTGEQGEGNWGGGYLYYVDDAGDVPGKGMALGLDFLHIKHHLDFPQSLHPARLRNSSQPLAWDLRKGIRPLVQPPRHTSKANDSFDATRLLSLSEKRGVAHSRCRFCMSLRASSPATLSCAAASAMRPAQCLSCSNANTKPKSTSPKKPM